jgi:hypothetical protein
MKTLRLGFKIYSGKQVFKLVLIVAKANTLNPSLGRNMVCPNKWSQGKCGLPDQKDYY